MDMKFSVMFVVLLWTSCLALETRRSAVASTSPMNLDGILATVIGSIHKGNNKVAVFYALPISPVADCLQKVELHCW